MYVFVCIFYKQHIVVGCRTQLHSKTKDRKVKQSSLRTGTSRMGEGQNEKVKEGEYGRNIMYSCMSMEK
jgi:hypothetical protein